MSPTTKSRKGTFWSRLAGRLSLRGDKRPPSAPCPRPVSLARRAVSLEALQLLCTAPLAALSLGAMTEASALG